jgi:SAM-dependent methyltransferase
MNVQTAPSSIDFTPSKSGRHDAGGSGMSNTDNTLPIEAWNTVLFEKFCRFRHIMSKGLSGHSDELFRRKPYPADARVLDIGCGFGDTTQRIAAQVTSGGEAIGVDCAQNFIDLATREADEEPIKNASFFVADAQCDDLGVPTTTFFRASSPCSSICRVSRCATSGARSHLVAS